MRMDLKVFFPHIVNRYNLDAKAKRGVLYLEIRKTIYGLPQAGILANKQLNEKLLPGGYNKIMHTPGLWRHIKQPIQVTLAKDNICIKYEGKNHLDHMIAAIRKAATGVKIEKMGSLYSGITLK